MSGKVQLLTNFLKAFSSGWPGYGRWVPGKMRVVSAGEGSCVCEMTVDEDLVNVNNHLHGGCTATIVDIVSYLAQLTSKNQESGVSVELSVAYMSAAKLGEDIVIDAKTIKSGKNLAFLQVDLSRKSDGAMIAVGKHMKYMGQGVRKNADKFLKNSL